MSYIDFNNVTKDYGLGRGLFNVDFHIEKGESFGIVGINGAGKTTIIRHLMGFVSPNSGDVKINGFDAFKDAKDIKKLVCYIPGEINFPPLASGDDFIKQQAKFWSVSDLNNVYDIVRDLQLDTRANLKKMSKGMKQKTAISVAFLPDNDILIFDEPTTGLDPLMRNEFVDIIEKERNKGKTIIMSSHMFDELEECCDRVAMIKDGKLLKIVDIKSEIKQNKEKTYKIEFLNLNDYNKFLSKYKIEKHKEIYLQVVIKVADKDVNEFISDIVNYDIKFIKEIKPSLEEIFLELYKKDDNKGEENV